ncbi:MAG TPA: DUF998 domain-containing protein [Chitinophaga sp.]
MRRLLFLCGLLSSLLYAGADIISAAAWKEYSYASQAISELMAINAPSRPVAVPFFVIYDLLVITFGTGLVIWPVRKRLRLAGGLITGVGITGLITTLFFPMHLRGEAPTLSDTMHIILTGVTTVLIVLAIVSSTAVYGKGFRYYSIFTIVILLVFGALAGLDGPRIAAGQPTPWLGITERITIGAYLLWIAILSVILLRAEKKAA